MNICRMLVCAHSVYTNACYFWQMQSRQCNLLKWAAGKSKAIHDYARLWKTACTCGQVDGSVATTFTMQGVRLLQLNSVGECLWPVTSCNRATGRCIQRLLRELQQGGNITQASQGTVIWSSQAVWTRRVKGIATNLLKTCTNTGTLHFYFSNVAMHAMRVRRYD